jgi:hypothetical protein
MFPFSLKHRVAYVNVYSEISFSSSVDRWRSDPKEERQNWKMLRRQTEPMTLGERDGIEIDGDCTHPISAEQGGLVHINGDLKSHLVLGGHHEVIIHGDVAEQATIRASGFHRLFVSGSMKGQLRSTEGAKLWVDNDFVGSLETGTPSTSLHIGNDFLGSVSPYMDAALLWMTIHGFASQESLNIISGFDYTVFEASVARSDIEPGFYPQANANRKTKSGYCTSHWSVGREQ